MIRLLITLGLAVSCLGDCGKRPLLSDNGASEIAGLKSRIVGGFESQAFSWPHICSFTDRYGRHMCGGTLVKNTAGQFVFITAAHCVDIPSGERYHAKCGMHSVNGDSPSHLQTLDFDAVWQHAGYNPNTFENDIVMFRFKAQPVENQWVQAACLAEDDHTEGEKSIVVGWGTLSSGGAMPDKLRQVNKPIKSDAMCSQRLGSEFKSGNMMCAGYTQGGADACQGDSGGPLYTYRNSTWYLTGVVSWGYGCADPMSPGVYADVYSLRSWISTRINQ